MRRKAIRTTTAILLFAIIASCAHGLSTHIDKLDENTPKDYDPDAYNREYEQKHRERKKEDPRFDSFRKKIAPPL